MVTIRPDVRPVAINAKVLAAQLSVSVNTVYQLANEGKIPGAVRLGNRWRFPTDAAQRFMQTSVIEPEPARSPKLTALGFGPRSARSQARHRRNAS